MMKECTFFGHRVCPEWVGERLREVLTALIESGEADCFYVGRQGGYDRMVRSVLRELKIKNPRIRYAVVLERLPKNGEDDDLSDTMLPEGLECVPPRFAIAKRNDWMLSQADIVITYVTHGWSGAAKYAEAARQSGKRVIRPAEKNLAAPTFPCYTDFL